MPQSKEEAKSRAQLSVSLRTAWCYKLRCAPRTFLSQNQLTRADALEGCTHVLREGNVPRTLPATPVITDATVTSDGSPPVRAGEPEAAREGEHPGENPGHSGQQPTATPRSQPQGTQGAKTPGQAEEQLATLLGAQTTRPLL